jgi:hypothetical protein
LFARDLSDHHIDDFSAEVGILLMFDGFVHLMWLVEYKIDIPAIGYDLWHAKSPLEWNLDLKPDGRF